MFDIYDIVETQSKGIGVVADHSLSNDKVVVKIKGTLSQFAVKDLKLVRKYKPIKYKLGDKVVAIYPPYNNASLLNRTGTVIRSLFTSMSIFVAFDKGDGKVLRWYCEPFSLRPANPEQMEFEF